MSDEIPADLRERFLAVLTDAYQAGFRAGFAKGDDAVRQNIIQLISAKSATDKHVDFVMYGRDTSGRAPRGQLRAVIKKVLREQPGATALEIEDLAPKIDPQISPRSVGGELRRMRDVLYRQDGRHWYLIQSTLGNDGIGSDGGFFTSTHAADISTIDEGEANAAP